jgi:hypothetical protein
MVNMNALPLLTYMCKVSDLHILSVRNVTTVCANVHIGGKKVQFTTKCRRTLEGLYDKRELALLMVRHEANTIKRKRKEIKGE